MIECAVIGGGQAGLATSYQLGLRDVEHLVLERGRVAETWRTARWDGFHLNTPNWTVQLPGMESPGEDPDAFAPLAEVIGFLERYAGLVGAPVREQAQVTQVRPADGRFELTVDGDTLHARSLVVASGAFQQPTTRPPSAGVPELHSSAYCRPDLLPDGDVLVVGSGQSGCEIAQELLDAGREVHLSVGRCPWAPRRYRGREVMRWLVDVGIMDDTAASLPSPEARVAGNVTVSGARGGVDCSPLLLEEAGAQLHGRLAGFRDGRAWFGDDLDENLLRGITFERELCGRLDAYAAATGLDLPEPALREWPARLPDHALPLDLERIGSVLWANGFRPAFGWIDAPVFDPLGFPRTRRGVSEVPGLAFVGLPWLHTRRSPLLLGVGADAGHVADAIAAYLGRQTMEDSP
jgi:putative flavoprotein involved in K+ transport